MKCYNCGAQINEDTLICPYCGAEREDVARKQQQDILGEYKKKTEALQHIPGKIVKKTSRYLVIGAVGLFLGFVLCLLIGWLVSGWSAKNALNKQNQQLERLEAYYEAEEYEAMASALKDMEVSGATFEKYRLVSGLYDQMSWRIDAVKSEAEFIREVDLEAEAVAETLKYVIEELAEIQILADNGFVYGEEEGALSVKDAYMDALKTYMLLTEDEIETAVDQYEEESSCIELARAAIERLKKE